MGSPDLGLKPQALQISSLQGDPPPQDDPKPQPAPDSPRSFADTLVVTAARAEQRLTDAVAPTTVLGRGELARSPG